MPYFPDSLQQHLATGHPNYQQSPYPQTIHHQTPQHRTPQEILEIIAQALAPKPPQ
jgi:hypothetical protein